MGHSEDVCTYVKCDIGHAEARATSGPTGKLLPKPDLLLLSYTGCFTFMKWFELLSEEYDCPVVMLHVPYQADGKITPEMRDYVVEQLRERGHPGAREASPAASYDEERLRERLALSRRAEDDLVGVLRVGQAQALADRRLLRRRLLHRARSSPPSAAREEAVDYYRGAARGGRGARRARARARSRPTACSGKQKFRLVVEGPPNWTHFREFWRMFADEGAVVGRLHLHARSAGSTTTASATTPSDPLETPRRLLPGLLHQPASCPAASSCSRSYVADY